ncbi:MAG: hypothetical protein Q8L13_11745 [Bradyrhizobium sp.]|uniref:hypothetical protein n=1 Tax=Bradyrhizobium sp. TaxID=376 RepID=UPI00272F1000|nr:hypothetical protein [Bradyrhizobium sp.]MDP1866998.1 hypothetical protein [Bradyrhizobium sp.]
MAITLIKGPDAPDKIEGVERHHYANQVVSRGPLDHTYAFRKAAAHAKDRARHNQIKAIRKEEARLRSEAFAGSVTLSPGLDIVRADFSDQARANVLANRTIDGVRGASDDDIKL